jgi:hypothetical protein
MLPVRRVGIEALWKLLTEEGGVDANGAPANGTAGTGANGSTMAGGGKKHGKVKEVGAYWWSR